MREIIIRNIDNAPNGKEFFAGISGNFKDFGQTLCELIDNPISNFRAHKRRGRVEIVLEEQGDYVDVSVRDNGTGIENMDAALTIAARSCAESTLNEHGMGLKHARRPSTPGRISIGASRPGRQRTWPTTATSGRKAPTTSTCPCR